VNILTINTGSSSVRLAAFLKVGDKPEELASAHYGDEIGSPEEIIRGFLQENGITKISVASHRVVHGGMRLATPCLITKDVEEEIHRLSSLAPLHNPRALEWIRGSRGALGSAVPQVAVFDTGFFASLPGHAATYALPRELLRKHEIRRYGFHGLAHQSMWEQWAGHHPERRGRGRLITLQLGAGCSASAIEDGRPLDTSMGFSPLEGLVMATRCGDVDAGAVTYIMREAGLSPGDAERMLNKSSGLLGLSGISEDMRALLADAGEGARLAVEIYCHRVKKYIGAYMAVLGGADAVSFSGGVGENAPRVREKALEGLGFLGIVLDPRANDNAVGKEGLISSAEGAVEAWVLPADEALVLAREAAALIG